MKGMVQDDPLGAIPYFEKAVGLSPCMHEAYYNLGNCYVQAMRIENAVEAFRKAIRYGRHEKSGALAREKLQWLANMIRQTTCFLTLEAYIGNERLFNQAFDNLRHSRFEKAAELFRKALEQNPRHVQSYGNLALALAGLGQRNQALHCLDKALEIDPSYQPARRNRKIIKRMNEGEPLANVFFLETEYYRERLEAERGRGA
jgi:tetratricopeptide (TPR) repeat protein